MIFTMVVGIKLTILAEVISTKVVEVIDLAKIMVDVVLRNGAHNRTNEAPSYG